MAINPIAKQYGVPLFSAISGTHKATIDFGHPFVVQTQPHTLMEGKALAEYAARKGWKNIVTMGLDYEWGRTTVKVFTEELAKLNPDAKITRQLWPRIGETNLTSYITAAPCRRAGPHHGRHVRKRHQQPHQAGQGLRAAPAHRAADVPQHRELHVPRSGTSPTACTAGRAGRSMR